MDRPLLVSIAYSPWSLRARMALDLAGVDYQKQEYIPGVSEPGLRWKLGRWSGPVTVPVLFTDDGPITDSFDIAQWASDRSGGTLVPADAVDRIRRVNEHTERVLEAGRLRTSRLVLDNPAALRESLPGPIRALGPVGLAIGRMSVNNLLSKYARPGLSDNEGCLRQMGEALAALKAELGDGPTILDRLSYADLTGVAALTFVSPHPKAPLGEVVRPLWSAPDLAAAHPELVAWRDRVYATWSAALKRG